MNTARKQIITLPDTEKDNQNDVKSQEGLDNRIQPIQDEVEKLSHNSGLILRKTDPSPLNLPEFHCSMNDCTNTSIQLPHGHFITCSMNLRSVWFKTKPREALPFFCSDHFDFQEDFEWNRSYDLQFYGYVGAVVTLKPTKFLQKFQLTCVTCDQKDTKMTLVQEIFKDPELYDLMCQIFCQLELDLDDESVVICNYCLEELEKQRQQKAIESEQEPETSQEVALSLLELSKSKEEARHPLNPKNSCRMRPNVELTMVEMIKLVKKKNEDEEELLEKIRAIKSQNITRDKIEATIVETPAIRSKRMAQLEEINKALKKPPKPKLVEAEYCVICNKLVSVAQKVQHFLFYHSDDITILRPAPRDNGTEILFFCTYCTPSINAPDLSYLLRLDKYHEHLIDQHLRGIFNVPIYRDLSAEVPSEDSFTLCHACGTYIALLSFEAHSQNVHPTIRSKYTSKRAISCDYCLLSLPADELKVHLDSVHLRFDCSEYLQGSLPSYCLQEKIQPMFFLCEICGFTLQQHKQWKQHQKVHEKSEVFVCLLCSSTFASLKALNHHENRVHVVVATKRKCRDHSREVRRGEKNIKMTGQMVVGLNPSWQMLRKIAAKNLVESQVAEM